MRTAAIFEPLLMFALIVAYIWKLRFVQPYSWLAIAVLMLASHWWHGESARSLGFAWHSLRKCFEELAPLLVLIVLALLAAGYLLRTMRQVGFDRAFFDLAVYVPWGLAQQYALNGYFLNRLDGVLSRRDASLTAAALFAAVHAPNPFLMAITLLLGWCATLLYRRTRNLYLLGIAHGAIGLLLFLVVPDSISHHLRVGPRWFLPLPRS